MACRGYHQIPTFPGKKTSYTGSGAPGGRQARPAPPSGRSGPWLDLPAPPEPHPLPAPLPIRSRPALNPNVPEPRPSPPPRPPGPLHFWAGRSLHGPKGCAPRSPTPPLPPPREAPWAPPGGHRGEAAANQTGLTPPCGSAPSLVRHVAPGAREGPGEVLGVAAWCRHLANPSPARHELWGRPAAADTPATPGLPGGRGTGPNSEPLNSPPPGAKGTELSSGRRTPCGHPQPAMTEGEAPGCGDPVSAGGRGLLGEEGDRSATCMAVCHRSLRWLLGNSTRSSSPRAQGQFGTLSPGAVYTDSAAS